MPRPRSVNYIDDDRLWYEIRLSQGKGFLTPEAIVMLLKLARHMITIKQFYNPKDKEDALQTGILKLLTMWPNFNYKKYNKALPYFSEIFKRGMVEGFNETQNGNKGKNTFSINNWDSI